MQSCSHHYESKLFPLSTDHVTLVLLNRLPPRERGCVCLTKDLGNPRGIPKYDREVMVSPHVRIGEGTGVEEGHILLKEKFQLHLKEIFNFHKDHNENAHF